MIKIYSPEKENWSKLLTRPQHNQKTVADIISNIFADIQLNGDDAVNKYTAQFDAVAIKNSKVTADEIVKSAFEVSPELKDAIALAKSNIEKFHIAQQTAKVQVETTQGVYCWQEKKPIQKVGLYIPGGTAPLFSTVLMLAVPAKIANCDEIILCSPPDKNGNIHPAILFTASLCGVTKIFKVGGTQAIAAMTLGTETIPRVYKIFGPGNQYVTAAKQFAQQFGVAIDMPAGPSELMIFADDSANAAFVAADLLSQAEHGVDSQVIFVSTSKVLIDAVELEISKQVEVLPRQKIANAALLNSKVIYVETDQIALDIINDYAPEHLIICSNNENFFVDNIHNAGSVFIGNYTPESAGDYASGTNHTLPTNGFARNYSGVNLDSFLKAITFQKITQQGIQNIGNAIEIMAETEGLHAHKNAVTLRLNDISI